MAFFQAGYQVNALRYICKPVRAEQISGSLDITYGQWLYNLKEHFILETTQGKHVMKIRDIVYIEARDHVLEFHRTANGANARTDCLYRVR
ncbi:MAG: hypothetical protein RR337_08845 [Clostridia bacterium]